MKTTIETTNTKTKTGSSSTGNNNNNNNENNENNTGDEPDGRVVVGHVIGDDNNDDDDDDDDDDSNSSGVIVSTTSTTTTTSSSNNKDHNNNNNNKKEEKNKNKKTETGDDDNESFSAVVAAAVKKINNGTTVDNDDDDDDDDNDNEEEEDDDDDDNKKDDNGETHNKKTSTNVVELHRRCSPFFHHHKKNNSRQFSTFLGRPPNNKKKGLVVPVSSSSSSTTTTKKMPVVLLKNQDDEEEREMTKEEEEEEEDVQFLVKKSSKVNHNGNNKTDEDEDDKKKCGGNNNDDVAAAGDTDNNNNTALSSSSSFSSVVTTILPATTTTTTTTTKTILTTKMTMMTSWLKEKLLLMTIEGSSPEDGQQATTTKTAMKTATAMKTMKTKMGQIVEWIVDEGPSKMKTFATTLNDTAVKFHDEILLSTWTNMTTDTKIKSIAGLMLVIGIMVGIFFSGGTGAAGFGFGFGSSSKTASLQHSLVMDQIESLQLSVDMIRMEQIILKTNVSEANTYLSLLMEELGSKQNHIGRTVNIMKQLQGKSFVETMTNLTCSSSLQQKLTDLETELQRSKSTTTNLLCVIIWCLLLAVIGLKEDLLSDMTRPYGTDRFSKNWLNGLKIFAMISTMIMIVYSFAGVGATEHELTMGRSTSTNFQNIKTTMKSSHVVPGPFSSSKMLSKRSSTHMKPIILDVDQDQDDTTMIDFLSAKSNGFQAPGEILGSFEPEYISEGAATNNPQVSNNFQIVVDDSIIAFHEDSQQAVPSINMGHLWYCFFGWMLCAFVLVKMMMSEQKLMLPRCYSSEKPRGLDYRGKRNRGHFYAFVKT